MGFVQGVSMNSSQVTILPLLIALATGVFIAVLGPINSNLQLRSGTWGLSTIVHITGLTLSLLGLLLLQKTPVLDVGLATPLRLTLWGVALLGLLVSLLSVQRGLSLGVPLYAYLGGLIGLLVILGTVFSIQSLGVVTAMTLILAAQLLTGAVVDHFGLLGQSIHLISLPKLLGLVLVAGGTLLTLR